MKVNIIYDNNYLISTKINRPIKIRDLIFNLKNESSNKMNFLNKNYQFILLNESYEKLEDGDRINIETSNDNLPKERKLYLVTQPTYKKPQPKDSLPKEDLIMKVTGAKT